MLAPTEAQSRETAAPVIARIRTFMAGCSFEATRPDAEDVAALRQFLKPGDHIYMSAVPGRPISETLESARALRMAGFEPVPHIAARNFATLRDCAAALERFAGEAEVKAIMLIGGDVDSPVGPLTSAHELIESGLIAKYGIVALGLAAYPEAHPRISADKLEASLVTKLASAQSQGLAVHIVTQFCFDAKPIVRWIAWLRGRGIHTPVRIGLAGPTSMSTWMTYARRCGVKASAAALARRAGLVRHAFKAISPDPIISELSERAEQGQFADVSPHMYSFGGIAATARWLQGVRAGRFALESEGGFHVHVS